MSWRSLVVTWPSYLPSVLAVLSHFFSPGNSPADSFLLVKDQKLYQYPEQEIWFMFEMKVESKHQLS